MYEVRIIIARAEQAIEHASEIINEIPEYYRNQYRRIKRKQEACQELMAGFLLKKYLGVCKDEQLIRADFQKPGLRSGGAFFNLSHSGEYVALAIAEIDIGVDLERITEVNWWAARKVFGQKQMEQLKHAKEREQPLLFAELWTKYEAVLKLMGTGFAVEVEEFGLEDKVVCCAQYKDYILTCAAREDISLAVEEFVWGKA